MIRSFGAHVRDHLVRGLLLLLPLIITIWLLRLLFGLISNNVTPWVAQVIRAAGFHGLDDWRARFLIPLIGVFLTFLVVYLFGLLAANLLGKRLFTLFEEVILKIPFVKTVYGGSRQLIDAFNVGNKGGFSRVVAAEYPRVGVWTVGFVTNEVGGGAAGSLLVFFPTTPNPTSGWLAVVPAADVVDLDMSVEEGIKLIVSGGIVLPEGPERRAWVGDLAARAGRPR